MTSDLQLIGFSAGPISAMTARSVHSDGFSVGPNVESRTVYGTSHQDLLSVQLPNSSHNYGPIHVNDSSAVIGNNYNVNVTYSDKENSLNKFLDSLHHPEMNSRYNEIKEASNGTFEWVFDETKSDPTTTKLRSWLRSDEQFFLIRGKPGSGKSTFVKFLFHNRATQRLLNDSDSEKPFFLMFHGFWLSGTTLQHNLKGLMASLAFHILEQQPSLYEGDLLIAERSVRRRCIGDWSEDCLELLLIRLCEACSHRLCFFLDGLDEYDNQADFDNLMDLLDRIMFNRHKFCLSTRPNDHILRNFAATPGLRLQDLTAEDIQTHVRETLLTKTRSLSDFSVRDTLVHRLTTIMCEKAEGVFLWVYYVLKNVCIGIRNAEELRDLLRRVSLLPSALVDLYLHMWELRNEDNQIHREESAKLFALSRYLPMTVLEYAIAMDSSLCSQYARLGSCEDKQDLLNACSAFLACLNARSAGLLETNYDIMMLKLEHSQDGQDGQDHVDKTIEEMIVAKVNFIHLTVYDFLFSHTDSKCIRQLAWTPEENGTARALAFVASRPNRMASRLFKGLVLLLPEIAQETLELTPFQALIPTGLARVAKGLRSQSSYRDDWVYCVYFEQRMYWVNPSGSYFDAYREELAIDMQTLITATRPDVDAIDKYFGHYGHGWTPYYRAHLIMEASRVRGRDLYCTEVFVKQKANLVTPQTLTDANRMFIARSPALQMLVQLFCDTFILTGKSHVSRLKEFLPHLMRCRHHFGNRVVSLPTSFSFRTADDYAFHPYYTSTYCLGTSGREGFFRDLFVQFPVHAILQSLISMMGSTAFVDSEAIGTGNRESSADDASHQRSRHILAHISRAMFRVRRPIAESVLNELSYPNEEVETKLWHALIAPLYAMDESYDNYHGYIAESDVKAIYYGFDHRIPLSRADFMARFYPPEIEPDVYFMDEDTDTPAMQLDPYQEVDDSNWKEHCTMRNYFAKLAERETCNTLNGTQNRPETAIVTDEVTNRVDTSTQPQSSRKRPWEL